jgi:hypothetical protein
MKIACICASYNRPKLLGQAVAMFLEQDYPNKELLILEDSGIFGDTEISGNNWRLISTTTRMPCIASKRNFLVQQTDAEVVATFDDDDWYLPWHLTSAAKALESCEWTQPRQSLEWKMPLKTLARFWVMSERVRSEISTVGLGRNHVVSFCYGAQWASIRQAYLSVGGQPENYGLSEDSAWAGMMFDAFGPSADTESPPAYIYSRRSSGSWHTSEIGRGMDYHRHLGKLPKEKPSDFKVELPQTYHDWPACRIPTQVLPRKW